MSETKTPSTAALRRLIQEVLVSDSDLEAFCLDYFPDVQSRFSNGMDRTQKISLLMAAEDSQELLRALAEAEPRRFARFKHLMLPTSATYAPPEATPDSPLTQTAPAAASREYSREELFDLLCDMPVGLFEVVVFRLNLRSALLAPRTAPQSERALQIIELMESEGTAGLPRLTAAVAKTAPQFLK